MNNASLIIVMLLLLVSTSTYGAALGQSTHQQEESGTEDEASDVNREKSRDILAQNRRTSMLGYGIGLASITVDDPEGDTNTTRSLQPITIIYTNTLWDHARYWSEFYYYKATMDAKPKKVGQDVQRYGFRVSMQKGFSISSRWSVWLGGGLDLSQTVYTARHTVDSGGFLIDVLPKREDMTASVILNVFTEWLVKPDWTVGAKLEQSFSGSGYIEDILVAVNVLYRY